MNIEESSLIDIEIEKQQEEIYQKVRKKKFERTKKELLIEFGDTPLICITLINSLCVSFIITYYLIFFAQTNIVKSIFGINSITIIFGFIMSVFSLLLFVINITFVSLYYKSRSLYEKEKTK